MAGIKGKGKQMSDKVSMHDLEVEARNVGLAIASYSPGDGVTRYRVFEVDPSEEIPDYFGGRGSQTLITVLGRKALASYIDAFASGYRRGMRQGGNQCLATIGVSANASARASLELMGWL